MSEQVLITSQRLTDIANAIRVKLHTTNTYTPDEMPGAIREIVTMQMTATAKGSNYRPKRVASEFSLDGLSWEGRAYEYKESDGE
jgi:hypothetical protein